MRQCDYKNETLSNPFPAFQGTMKIGGETGKVRENMHICHMVENGFHHLPCFLCTALHTYINILCGFITFTTISMFEDVPHHCHDARDPVIKNFACFQFPSLEKFNLDSFNKMPESHFHRYIYPYSCLTWVTNCRIYDTGGETFQQSSF